MGEDRVPGRKILTREALCFPGSAGAEFSPLGWGQSLEWLALKRRRKVCKEIGSNHFL